MKKGLFFVAIIVLLASFTLTTSNKVESLKFKTIYSFKVPSIDSGKIDFSKFKGKKILVVNTANECQYAVQFANLQSLYRNYQDKLVIVGFPSNAFNQENSNETEIQQYCKTRYGVTFPMSTKTIIKGDSIAPIYKWLCNKKENGVLDAEIKWNFGKFLIDEKGRPIAYFASNVKPDSEEITKYLK